MIDSKTVGIGALLLIVGLGVGYFLWGASDNRLGVGQHMMGNGSMMGQGIDQHFIVQMIPHHEGAIEMAKIALTRSKRPEVLALAEGIIKAQEKEIQDMSAWYQSWFGGTPPEGDMGMMHMEGMEGDTAVLASISDADFDREFLEQMIPHHEMAIMMANMLAAGTERDEMKTLADQIITSQSKEIEMMRSWLAVW
jgi:uncharacterized protein (DUF305 family)